jgi:transcriptional regulator with XRE-family HTH domain
LTLRGITPKISYNVRQQQRRLTLEALRRARVDAGLTISETAKRAGVSRDTISNAERGRHSLQGPTLSKIAYALGRSPSELLAEEERLPPKAPRPSSLEPPLFNGLKDERDWHPSLRSWIDFVGHLADRWGTELEEREREWQGAEPHIRKVVKRLPNLSWATEIRGTYVDVLEAVNTELDYGLYVYDTAEVQEIFKNTRRLEEILERTEPWYQGEEAPRMAEVIDLQRAVAERVEKMRARSSESA